MRGAIWAGLISLTAVGVAAGAVARLYRRDMRRIRAGLAAHSRLAETALGPIEYSREGQGRAVLVIHGAGGGFDQGLMLGRGIFGADADLIAPSRFGYLGTPVPDDPSSAHQADAHAALLDALAIDRAVVVGASAGAPSAIEMALRHPHRVAALILVVPRAYAPGVVVGPSASAQNRLVLAIVMRAADFAFWIAMKIARSAIVRFLAVPPELERAAPQAERARVTMFIRSILPLSRRLKGLEVDGATQIALWPLERIGAPTLIVTAADDLYQTLPGARFTAEHIEGARLKIFETGGHLLVCRGDELSVLVADFLSACEREPEATYTPG